MGFEQVVPPIPDRRQEIDAMNRLEQSWLNQSYFRYYMNESLRQPKIAYSNIINKVYKEFLLKTTLASIALLPVAILSRRLFLRKGTFPVTFQPDYFNRIRTDQYLREWRYVKYVFPTYFLASFYFGYRFTDWKEVYDYDYEFVHKPKKML